MTKPRPPLSFAQGITRIAGLIGWDVAAALVGRSDRLVRLWSEPDKPESPTLDQALTLDAAFCTAGGDGAPLLDAYAMQLDLRVEAGTACHQKLAAATALAALECGEAIAATVSVIHPGASESEIHRAVVNVKEGVDALSRMLRHLNSILPNGAGPGAGTMGGAQ